MRDYVYILIRKKKNEKQKKKKKSRMKKYLGIWKDLFPLKKRK